MVLKKGGFGGYSPETKNRNKGTFACSPGMKTGTRVRSHVPPERKTGTRAHSPKPPFYETALLFPLDFRLFFAFLRSFSHIFQGENPVFGKPWFCLRDTRHFRHFRRFLGSEERNPLFLWVECKSSFSPFFVKTTCFR